MKYLYFGTSKFAATILEKLIANAMVPVAVVTQPDRPAGRGKKVHAPPVKIVAQKNNIPLLQPTKIENCKLEIENLHVDLCVVAAYGGIIPKAVLTIPKHGFLNVHSSLLPKYRGPSPIQTALLNGDKETGVTIMLLDEKVDHGPVLTSDILHMTSDITALELEKELAARGADLLIKTIPDWVAGKIKAIPQDHAKATFTKMITKEDGHIDWRKSAEEIERHVRAFVPWPGSWTIWKHDGKEMRLTLSKVSIVKGNSRPGSNDTHSVGKVISLSADTLFVTCGKDTLAVHELQPEGKQKMTARAFVNGHPMIIGTTLY